MVGRFLTKSAGGVVLNNRGEVVVTNQHGNSWSLPKGRVEKEEIEIETAKREIKEETGLSQLELLEDLGIYQRYRISLDGGDDFSELKEIRIFLFKTEEDFLLPEDKENPMAKWVKIDEVSDLLTHKKDKEFFLSIKDKLER